MEMAMSAIFLNHLGSVAEDFTQATLVNRFMF